MKRLLIALLLFPSIAFAWDNDPDPFPAYYTGSQVTNSLNDLYDNAQESVGDCGSGLVLQGVLQDGTRTCVSAGSGGSGTWLSLTDTPSSFTANYWVKVNAAGNALELVTAPSGSGDMLSTNNLSDVASAATAFTNIKQASSSTATGVIELATNAEVIAGTDTARAVTAAGVKALLEDGIEVGDLTVTGTDGTHGVTIVNNTSTPTLDPNTLSVDQNTLIWNDSADVQQEVYHEGNKDTAIAGESITSGTVADARIASTITRDSEVVSANTNLWQHTHKDLTAEQADITAVRIPTSVDWSSMAAECDGTSNVRFQPVIATTAYGTYSAVSGSAAFDPTATEPSMTGWTDLVAGNYVKLDITTDHSTGTATECVVTFNLVNN